MAVNSKKADSEKQLVVFGLANECYGVDIATVSEIICLQEIMRVPRAPKAVQGLINLRGKVIPVVDMRTIFDLAPGQESKENRIMVVDVQGQQIGIKVDSVTEVLRITSDCVEPAAALLTDVDSRWVVGIAKLPRKMITLMNLEQVLSRDQIAASCQDGMVAEVEAVARKLEMAAA